MRAPPFALRPASPASPAPAAPPTLALASVLALAALAGCAAAAPPQDLFYGPAYGASDPLEAAPPSTATLPTTGAIIPGEEAAITRRVLARSTTRALAVEAGKVYFGDEAENALMVVPVDGSAAPVVVGRPAPVAVAADARALAWIAQPGDVVLRAARGGARPVTLRDRSTFTALAASRGDVFIAEALEKGGALTRITGPTASRLATLDSRPLGVRVDDAYAYVLTAREIVRVPRRGGVTETLATGTDLARLELSRDHLYATAAGASGRAVVRVNKVGGELTQVARDVRDAPIAVFADRLYFFAEGQPELREVAVSGGAASVAAREESLARVTALAADDLRLYVGTESAGVLALARARPR